MAEIVLFRTLRDTVEADECPRCHRKEFEAVPEEYRYLVKGDCYDC